MKLCMTLLVRDEDAILRENIEYHLSRGVDFVIATDNRSVDDTRQILEEYERRGCLRYIYEPQDDYSQDLWVTRMARLAAEEHAADWVIHADADEFWWPENDGDLKSVLGETDRAVDGLIVQRSNFIAPNCGVDPKRFYREMQFRQRRSRNPLGGPLPPKICHRGLSGVYVRQGNHSFELAGRRARTEDSSELIIWHFPFRGFPEFQRKIQHGGSAYEKNQRLPEDVGETWRQLLKLDQAGDLRDYYDSQTRSSAEIQALVERGEAVHDPRFARYMTQLLEGQRSTHA